MKLGVFDSGIGGEGVAAALQQTFPDAMIAVVNDRTHVPYGNRPPEEVRALTEKALLPLLDDSCDVIVIACNTATALAIEYLRSKYPTQKFIGIEPMIKPAAELTKSGVVAVCATPATLASERYAQLIHTHGQHLTLFEPDCSDWAYLIENNMINRSHITSVIDDACNRDADVIVLGCTHYHWIKALVSEVAAGRAIVLEPSEAIGRRVRSLLQK